MEMKIHEKISSNNNCKALFRTNFERMAPKIGNSMKDAKNVSYMKVFLQSWFISCGKSENIVGVKKSLRTVNSQVVRSIRCVCVCVFGVSMYWSGERQNVINTRALKLLFLKFGFFSSCFCLSLCKHSPHTVCLCVCAYVCVCWCLSIYSIWVKTEMVMYLHANGWMNWLLYGMSFFFSFSLAKKQRFENECDWQPFHFLCRKDLLIRFPFHFTISPFHIMKKRRQKKMCVCKVLSQRNFNDEFNHSIRCGFLPWCPNIDRGWKSIKVKNNTLNFMQILISFYCKNTTGYETANKFQWKTANNEMRRNAM